MRARLKVLLLYFLYWVAFFAALRLVFLLFFAGQSRNLPLTTLAGTLVHGLRLDLSAAAYLSLIPFLLVGLSVVRRLARWTARVIAVYTLAWTGILAFLAAADLAIFREWGRRIDAAVLQYLTHPREIWASAGGVPRWLLLGIFALVTLVFARLFWRGLRPRLVGLPPLHPAGGVPLAFCAALLVVPARGGVQQIPVNQSSAYFSPIPFANQAALNAGWNFIDSWKRGLDRTDNPYVVMPMDSARALISCCRPEAPPAPKTEPPPLRVAPGDAPRPNLLLIIWEGLTARAVERLGGVWGATPEFERLADGGLLFRRFYASGDRTEKGLAALLSGSPTIPNGSILTVPSKSRTLEMLSRDLSSAGYATSFYYGGELGFANIKSYVLEGRFDRVLGKEDFPRSAWTSKWGIHDETVGERVLGDLGTSRRPFFAVWLTLSSHEPFDVPGPIRIPGSDGESRFLNSLAYTDHVVGDFLRRASR
ncbi:MAG TPA: sulfatase-like hydrolase/transferase, partial [Gemmatimonadales bacterium]